MSDYHPNWQLNRIRFVESHYGTDWFQDKTVLELGSFHSDIGNHFHLLGAQVTCVEGRESNANIALAKYPHLKIIVADLETWKIDTDYDLILHMGILYHLQSPQRSLIDACSHTRNMILESEVTDSLDSLVCYFPSERDHLDQSIHLIGSRPSPAYIERILTDCNMSFKIQKNSSLNGDGHIYDWEATNDGKFSGALRRRFWTIKSYPR